MTYYFPLGYESEGNKQTFNAAVKALKLTAHVLSHSILHSLNFWTSKNKLSEIGRQEHDLLLENK